MKTTLIQEPKFTWVGNDLFCGAVFFCRMTLTGTEKGYEHYRLEHVAFADKITEIGWEHWNGEPFDLKTAGRGEAIDLVESLYRFVLDGFDFETKVQ